MTKTHLALEVPLNTSCLIEASAGTGKTYTMAQIYLRLILGGDCEPLTVGQILVVTFTKDATQELKDRIRNRILETEKLFSAYLNNENELLTQDYFLFKLYQSVQNKQEALLRLKLAAQDMDLAAIYTIHSFCQRMLTQFAFNSGIYFDLVLTANETALLKQLSEEVWRELYYPLDFEAVQHISQYVKNPQDQLKIVRNYINKNYPKLVEVGFDEKSKEKGNFINEVKQYWLKNKDELLSLIIDAINKKELDGRTYKEDKIIVEINNITEWAIGESYSFPKFDNYTNKKIKGKIFSPIFEKIEQYQNKYNELFSKEREEGEIYYQFLIRLQQKLNEYKQTHKEKNFDDLIRLLKEAVLSEQGNSLIQQIRQEYHFAMIDEFQDTDTDQYQIFSRIFMDENNPCGFIMIGDPKQSIYKFRGADIFSYLKAASTVKEIRTLSKNWRSLPEIVNFTNQLFLKENNGNPFIYSDIQFTAVDADDKAKKLVGQESVQVYLQQNDKFNEKLAAQQCAYLIQQQLKQSLNKEFFLQEEYCFTSKEQADSFIAKLQQTEKEAERVLLSDVFLQQLSEEQYIVEVRKYILPQDIAVLVKSKEQGKLLKNQLNQLGIASVYLSERANVFESDEAKDLLLLLKACLNPYDQQAILNSLGTLLWGKTANELFQLKQSDGLAWDLWINKFIQFNQHWLQQGILPMLHHLFLQEEIMQQIATLENADRKITNLFHLAELLQQAATKLENENALVHWLEQQIDHPQQENDNNDGNEQELRLESEENLIKIITIHGSKGLQYPVVWLPFTGKMKDSRVKREDKNRIFLYRDENFQLQWDFLGEAENAKNAYLAEEHSEDLRLLYVALTRAESQLNLLLSESMSGTMFNPIRYLLENKKDEKLILKNTFEQKQIPAKFIDLDNEWQADNWLLAEHLPNKLENLSVREFNRDIQRNCGQVTSYSALTLLSAKIQESYQTVLPLTDPAKDYDQQFEEITQEIQSDESDTLLAFSPFTFPKGAKVGDQLHKFFEKQDFKTPISNEKLTEFRQKLQLDEPWQEILQTWFEQIKQTKLTENGSFCLADIYYDKRLNEWEFYLRLRNITALPKLNQLLKQYSPLVRNYPVNDLQLFELEGYIKGFVDCIVEHNDQYFILDYKSNYLGNLNSDYQGINLERAMIKHRYDLQFILYTLALHRYLRFILGSQYDYERNFGGVAYLFLRGMNGETGSGIYFEKPTWQLIDELDQLFA